MGGYAARRVLGTSIPGRRRPRNIKDGTPLSGDALPGLGAIRKKRRPLIAARWSPLAWDFVLGSILSYVDDLRSVLSATDLYLRRPALFGFWNPDLKDAIFEVGADLPRVGSGG